MPTKTLDTETVLQSILTENTGRSLLDSGDHYGRHWEENQGRDFESEDPVKVNFSARTQSAVPSINVYHYLKRHLEYAPEVDSDFQEFLETGLYTEGDPMTFNSYNGECALSQTIQGVLYHTSDRYGYDGSESIVLLQVHGGCDVRGGYTRPRAFTPATSGARLFLWADASLHDSDAGPHGTYWQTDDAGYNWYMDGSTAGKRLGEYDWEHVEEALGSNVDREAARTYACEDEVVLVTGDYSARSPLSGAELVPS